jgi:hypothetical protein
VPPVADGGHAGQRAGAGTSRQRKQHGLGLVVARVAEQHRSSADLVGGLGQCGVPRLASGGLGALTRWLHPYSSEHHGVEAQLAAGLGSPLGRLSGLLLQAVVDHHRTCPQALPRRLESGRRRQGQRVGAAADGHENVGSTARKSTGDQRPEVPAHRRPNSCDRRVRTAHRLQPGRRLRSGVDAPHPGLGVGHLVGGRQRLG